MLAILIVVFTSILQDAFALFRSAELVDVWTKVFFVLFLPCLKRVDGVCSLNYPSSYQVLPFDRATCLYDQLL